MSSYRQGRDEREIGVELKYCEHCGGLWVRERGVGVYCEKCQPKVDELAVGRKRNRRVKLPSRPRSVVDDFCVGIADEDLLSFAAAGGVA